MKKYAVFRYGDSTIDDYVYFGVTTNYDNTFSNAIRKQLDQERRAPVFIIS